MPGDQTMTVGADRPAITLVGPHVCLGPLHRGLLPLLWAWESDLALSVLTGDPTRPLTPEAIEADYECATKSGPERAGFREVGRRREAQRIGTRAFDKVFMDCLSTDPREPLLPNLIP